MTSDEQKFLFELLQATREGQEAKAEIKREQEERKDADFKKYVLGACLEAAKKGEISACIVKVGTILTEEEVIGRAMAMGPQAYQPDCYRGEIYVTWSNLL